MLCGIGGGAYIVDAMAVKAIFEVADCAILSMVSVDREDAAVQRMCPDVLLARGWTWGIREERTSLYPRIVYIYYLPMYNRVMIRL